MKRKLKRRLKKKLIKKQGYLVAGTCFFYLKYKLVKGNQKYKM